MYINLETAHFVGLYRTIILQCTVQKKLKNGAEYLNEDKSIITPMSTSQRVDSQVDGSDLMILVELGRRIRSYRITKDTGGLMLSGQEGMNIELS
jgi:hypothetical protein